MRPTHQPNTLTCGRTDTRNTLHVALMYVHCNYIRESCNHVCVRLEAIETAVGNIPSVNRSDARATFQKIGNNGMCPCDHLLISQV